MSSTLTASFPWLIELRGGFAAARRGRSMLWPGMPHTRDLVALSEGPVTTTQVKITMWLIREMWTGSWENVHAKFSE